MSVQRGWSGKKRRGKGLVGEGGDQDHRLNDYIFVIIGNSTKTININS